MTLPQPEFESKKIRRDLDKRAIQLGGGPWIELANRATLWRLLNHLLENHRRDTRRSSTLHDLVDATYPNEQLLPEAAANRIYFSLSNLRKLGLRPILQRNEEGYRIDPDWILKESRLGHSVSSIRARRPLPQCNFTLRANPFIGRESQIQTLENHWQRGCRLVVLQGPAGAGKTRLAREAGFHNHKRFAAGVSFIDLSNARTEPELVSTIGRTLEFSLSGKDLVGELVQSLSHRGSALLILDNIEQVMDDATRLLARIHELAPEISVLVTSRVRLPLSRARSIEVATLSPQEAVELFIDRSRVVRPNFVADKNDRQIAELVQRLDLLPLAVELAAARSNILTPRQINQRLDDRFRILRSSDEGQPERHLTMRAAIDWSWELASPVERAALAQCSVFRGGFTLEAAEEVLDLSDFTGSWPDEVIEGLVDRSLLNRIETSDHRIRFGLNNSIRVYAEERLEDENALLHGLSGPGVRRALEERHLHYFAQMGRVDVLRHLHLEGGNELRMVLVEELDNLEKAVATGLARGQWELAVQAWEAAFWSTLFFKGPFDVLVQRTRDMAKLDLPPRQRAAILMTEAFCHNRQGVVEKASAVASRVLEMTEGLEEITRARGLSILSRQALFSHGETEEAIALAEKARALFHCAKALYEAHFEWVRIAQAHLLAGRSVQCRQLIQQMKQTLLDHNDFRNLGALSCLSSRAYLRAGKTAEAIREVDRAIELYSQVGDQRNLCISLADRAGMSNSAGEPEEVFLPLIQRAMEISTLLGNQLNKAICHGHLGFFYLSCGDMDRAQENLERAFHLTPPEQTRARFMLQSGLALVRAKQGAVEAARAMLDEARDGLRKFPFCLGPVHIRSFDVELIARDFEAAKSQLDAALQIARQLELPQGAPLMLEISERRQLLRAPLD